MYKSCSKCGKIHDAKYRCISKREYRETNERALRNTWAWANKSREIRDRANHLCEVCKAGGVYQYNGLEVHHIVKIRDDETKLLDDLNLICLCCDCHKKADRNEIDKEHLQKLAWAREYGYTPPVL